MEAKATAKWARTSAPKLRRLTRLIVGKSVPEAQAILRLAPSPAAREVRKVLMSAAANAEDRFDAEADDLHVARAYVDEGLTLKRFRPRARGMANRIRKRTSHVTVVVGDVEPEVFCHLDRVLASGDAEDHCKIILSAPGAPLIDIELTNSSAYAQALWFVMGSSGGLTGDENRLEWKYVDWSKMPPRPVDTDPTAANRQYCPEQYEWIEESWDRSADAPPKSVPFYDDLYETIRNGAPLVITPRNVRRQIAILEKCAKVRAGLPPFQAATDG